MTPDPGSAARDNDSPADVAPDTEAYRRMFDAIPYPMWVYDAETLRFLAVNEAAIRRYGWSREEFLKLTIRDIRPPEDVPPLERHLSAPGQGLEHSGVWRHRLKTGEPVEVDVTAHALDFAGRPARLVLALDVTEARRTQETLRWLRRAVEQTESAILLTDAEGVITYVNPAFERLYGYTLEHAVGQTPRLLKSGEMSPDHYASLWHTLRAGRNYRGTHVNRTRSGELVVVEASVTPLRGEDDEIAGFVAIHHDVTERRNLERKRELLEAQLAHAQRLEALGTLAAGMAHDFNHLLGVVLGHAALLAQGPAEPERVARAAEALRLAGERGSSLVQHVLTFARRTDGRFEVADAWAIVAEVERLLRDILPKTIVLEIAEDPGRALVWADRGQLQQVLLNLCLNARDAMPAGGRLSLRVARVPGSRVRERLPEAAASDYVELSVTDTGSGMSEDTRRRAFEPFFTTKPSGKGSGLGLAVVYGIVQAHGGRLDLESAQGRGTVLRLYLPLCLSPEPARGAPAPEPPRPGGVVLLVEDDELIEEVGRAWLEGAGYQVLSARDGDEALRVFREQQGLVHVVVCDMGLPGLSGREVFHALRRLAPLLPVVLVSGLLDPGERVELAQAGAAGFLQKPYRSEQLLHVVAQARAPRGGG